MADPNHRPLLRLFAVLIFVVIEMGIAFPVLPALARLLNATALDIGLLFAIQSFGQFVAAPLWGSLSDRIGRKRVLLITIVLVAIGQLLTGLTTSLAMLYVVRLAVGLCSGGIATASAYVADVTDAATRSRGMAVVGVSFGLGFTIGPGLGAVLGQLTKSGVLPGAEALPFFVAAGLGFANALWGALLIRERAKTAEERANARRGRPSLREVRTLLSNDALRGILKVNLLYTIAVSILESTFFVFAEGRYSWDERQVGAAMAGMGILMALFQGGVGRVSSRVGDRRMVAFGLTLVASGLVIAPFFQAAPLLLTFLGIATVGRAFAHPGLLALTSSTAPSDEEVGKVMGALQSSGSLGRIIGPAIGGATFQYLHPDSPFWIAGASVLAITAWWWWSAKRPVATT